jgi:hypothetical protein
MKYLLMLLTFVCIESLAQVKTRRFTVADISTITIDRSVTYSPDDMPRDTTYSMMGQDARYKSLVKIVSLKYGSIYAIKELLEKCLESLKEDAGTSFRFKGNKLYIETIAGAKEIILFGEGDDYEGYVVLNKALITKLLNKVNTYLASPSSKPPATY